MKKLRLFDLLAVAAFAASLLTTANASLAAPKPGHVFIIVLENEGYDKTFGPNSRATVLNSLARQGALLQNYYGIGHYSLDNYIAMISGQAPNPLTQADCQGFVEFVSTGMAKDGQAIGMGCVYPKSTSTIVNQLKDKGLTWKAYMEDMGNIPTHERATCGHPVIGELDKTQKAVAGDQYATRHNPFMYFHSIIDDAASCDAHVVNLSVLASDLQDEKTTPNYVFITPNLCHDGHDILGPEKKCVDGQPGGLTATNDFLQDMWDKIKNSPAYKRNGLLIITFDEADAEGGDASACCNERRGPNIEKGSTIVFCNCDRDKPPEIIQDKGPGVSGLGGGRTGAVLISRFIKPKTISRTPYNHYSLLRSVEKFFNLQYLGYAGQSGLKSFGKDVFTQPGG
jgi:hypothetical protein